MEGQSKASWSKGTFLKSCWVGSSSVEHCHSREELEHFKISIKVSYSLILNLILYVSNLYSLVFKLFTL